MLPSGTGHTLKTTTRQRGPLPDSRGAPPESRGPPLRADGLHAWSIIGWLSRPNSAARLRSCPAPIERRSEVTQKFESGTRARSIFWPYCFATLRCPLRRHVSSSGPAQARRWTT